MARQVASQATNGGFNSPYQRQLRRFVRLSARPLAFQAGKEGAAPSRSTKLRRRLGLLLFEQKNTLIDISSANHLSVAQLEERVVWDHEAAGAEPARQTSGGRE